MCFIYRGNLLHFPSTQDDEEKGKFEGDQGTSTVDQNSGRQDATVQTEKGTGERAVSAPGDDTESLHSQVRAHVGYLRGPVLTFLDSQRI